MAATPEPLELTGPIELHMSDVVVTAVPIPVQPTVVPDTAPVDAPHVHFVMRALQ